MTIDTRIENLQKRVTALTNGISKAQGRVPAGSSRGGEFTGSSSGGGKTPAGKPKGKVKETDESRVADFYKNAKPEARAIVDHMKGQEGFHTSSTGASVPLMNQKASFSKTEKDTEHYSLYRNIETDRHGNWRSESTVYYKGNPPQVLSDSQPKVGSGLSALKEHLAAASKK